MPNVVTVGHTRKAVRSQNKKYRNNNNQLLGSGLFYEFASEARDFLLYTREKEDKVVDGKTYVSLHKAYLELADVTESKFVEKYFESWDHFEWLCSTKWFGEYISLWRKELELRLRSSALENIVTIASEPSSKSYYEANKFLLQGGWKDSGDKKRTKVTKDEIKKTLDKEEDDYLRIFNIDQSATVANAAVRGTISLDEQEAAEQERLN